ncbi:ABC transporter permease [Georgenia alba]|uniref:ABC transporter permease n=1 Tax=Georgenia alba TaxID=2233858 RepID=A0ABW2QAI2_9MICO
MKATLTSRTKDMSTESSGPERSGNVGASAATPGRRRLERSVPWVTTVAIVVVEELLSRVGALPDEVPPFTAVVQAAVGLVPTPEFVASLMATIGQFAAGLASGAVVGVGLGVTVGSVPLLHRLTHYVLDFLRFIPAVVYLPVLVLVLGATPQTCYILAAVGTVWPMLFQTYYGVVGVPPILKDTGRVFGLKPHQRLVQIVLPAVSPFIATGLRIAALHALVVVVAVQIITTVDGLGRDISVYATNGVYPEMYALVGIVGLLGVFINFLLEALERRLLHWHSSHRKKQS